jgi:hypothetical protein
VIIINIAFISIGIFEKLNERFIKLAKGIKEVPKDDNKAKKSNDCFVQKKPTLKIIDIIHKKIYIFIFGITSPINKPLNHFSL